jgi:PadR family transcriptional regulator, regulatory protein PadR
MKDHRTHQRTPQVRPTNLLMPLILVSLQQWNSYGYELMHKTSAFWQEAVNPGTLYRTLSRMEENGDIESTWDTNKTGPARKMYSITDVGEAYLELWMAALQQSRRNTDAFLRLYYRLPNQDN